MSPCIIVVIIKKKGDFVNSEIAVAGTHLMVEWQNQTLNGN